MAATKLDQDDLHAMMEIEQLHQQSTLDLLAPTEPTQHPLSDKKKPALGKFIMPSVLDELDEDFE